jgi:NAD+ synthetase
VRVALVQGDPVIGDLERNVRICTDGIACAAQAGARIALGSEMVISGYPPRDLLERTDFVEACRAACVTVAAATAGTDVIAVFGAPWDDGGRLRNAAVVAHRGVIVDVRYKSLLPTYDVFDEGRYFDPEQKPRMVEVDGIRLGITICEDIWNDPAVLPRRRYALDPLEAMQGCHVLLNLSASPFHAGKAELRRELLGRAARRLGVPAFYCNQVGGNDELLFDGGSFAVNAAGQVIAGAERFAARTLVCDAAAAPVAPPSASFEQEVHDALVMGIRDYAARCGFRTAVVGLSGGIDSAVVAALAVRALGASNVVGVGMPGPFSSEGSVTDARALAEALGIAFHLVPITPIHARFLEALAAPFAGRAPDVTEENLQARVRGTVLMAFSNKFGHLLLTTGNKSELAVGYCTLYGDMNGGLAVIADVFKTDVYRLARHINRERPIIPESTLTKPPSAELAPNQTDQDSLPPYDQLDAILRLYVEGVVSPDAIVAHGHPREVVERVVRLVVRNEYKRWQAAPALRVSARAFGSGRRLPLAQVWR